MKKSFRPNRNCSDSSLQLRQHDNRLVRLSVRDWTGCTARLLTLPAHWDWKHLMKRWLCLLGLFTVLPNSAWGDEALLHLNLRSAAGETKASWNPKKTALIICDMWDDHWCKSAARRVAELAGPMNQMIATARGKGVFVIHAPSSVTAFYKDTPQRKRAQQAPSAPTPVALATAQRWGTAWCWTDGKREGVLPIDDSDMGCDCAVKCTIREAWARQISAIEISEGDAITDNGQETWNLLSERGIDHVILCGVHLNMCVLGRPFGIRQMVKLGKNVALVRDMTDTMYCPDRPPGASHFEGTDLMVKHVEKFWCPSFSSSDITGKPAFRFKNDPRAQDR
jgi:Isochorismatase family